MSQTADELAAARANAAIKPILDAIAAERAAAEARAQQAQAAEAERIQGFSMAAARELGGASGQVNQAYGDAATRQATIGKGFSDGFRMAMQGNEQQANALLAKHGSPQTVDSVAGPGADVVYGLGGYIPATELNTQGAAFSSAAAMLPQTAIGRGEQDLRDARLRWGQQAQERNDSFDSERRRVLAEVPGLVSQERQTIFDRNRVRRDEAFRDKQFAADTKQASINAEIQWQSVKGTLAAYGLDERRLLQAEAEFKTDQTGVIHTVKNRRVVATKQPAPGSSAARNVADVVSAAGTSAKDKAKARKDALANRSDALTTAASAIRTASTDWGGKPIENPKPASLLNPGKYLDKNGKGTNDPNKAAREGGLTWSQMIARAMATEEVQQLVTRYGYSRAKAKAKVVAWLRAQGFTPPASPKKPARRRGDLGKPNRG